MRKVQQYIVLLLLSTVFSTVTAPVTDIDGNVYETVLIGEQLWMAENLKVTNYNSGSSIPTGLNETEWIHTYVTNQGAYSIYNNDESNAEIYGHLYNWYAVDDDRGICPSGWRVPTATDWNSVTVLFGGIDSAGGKLKESGTEHWSSPNTGATNESGFTGLPAGERQKQTGNYAALNEGTKYWSSSPQGSENAYSTFLHYNTSAMPLNTNIRGHGFSVRCLTDNIIEGCTDPSAINYNSLANVNDGSCYHDTVMDIDGNEYQAVQIGNQLWMKQNLKVTHYNNGDSIETTDLISYWNDLGGTQIGAYTTYPFFEDNAALSTCDIDCSDVYGNLYNAPTVEDSRNVCPDGWHVPYRSDWERLLVYIGMEEGINENGWVGDDAGKLKAIGTIEEGDGYWYSPNLNASDDYGFTALAGGYIVNLSGVDLGYGARFLSRNYFDNYNSEQIRLDYAELGIKLEIAGNTTGFSIRCLQTVEGCMDIDACNYDSDALLDDGSCWYAEEGYDCEGDIICDEGYMEIDGQCYYQSDLEILEYLKSLNIQWENLNILNFGTQEWDNGRLTSLNLYTFGLEGELPQNIGNLTELEYLELGNNDFFGIIPESFCDLVNLGLFYIYNNHISGEIPECIGLDLINLYDFRVNNNALSGSIPESIGNLTSLRFLSLYSNPISGEIPESIGNLTNLLWLTLRSMNLEGEIPESIGNLENLQWLQLQNNNLSGSIPESLSNLNVSDLHLYGNQLSGEIPDALGNLGDNLNDITLHDNQLTGQIPESLCDLDIIWLPYDGSQNNSGTLFNNHLCPPYPDCMVDFVGEQDISECVIEGCTDENACNYNLNSSIDDGSCEYPEDFGWCDCDSNVYDCFNQCGGSAIIDDCGICNGENLDIDECGVCFGDNSSCTGCTEPWADNYEDDNTIEDGSCYDFVDYPIHEGANLISFLSLPSDASTNNALPYSQNPTITSIIGEGQAASPSESSDGIWMGNLNQIYLTRGYWIKSSDATTISIMANEPLGHTDLNYSLHYGANLISFPFEGSYSLEEVLPPELINVLITIIGEGEAASVTNNGFMGNLNMLQGGKGYWFKVSEYVEFQFVVPGERVSGPINNPRIK